MTSLTRGFLGVFLRLGSEQTDRGGTSSPDRDGPRLMMDSGCDESGTSDGDDHEQGALRLY